MRYKIIAASLLLFAKGPDIPGLFLFMRTAGISMESISFCIAFAVSREKTCLAAWEPVNYTVNNHTSNHKKLIFLY
jgi:hypothetical protein